MKDEQLGMPLKDCAKTLELERENAAMRTAIMKVYNLVSRNEHVQMKRLKIAVQEAMSEAFK